MEWIEFVVRVLWIGFGVYSFIFLAIPKKYKSAKSYIFLPLDKSAIAVFVISGLANLIYLVWFNYQLFNSPEQTTHYTIEYRYGGPYYGVYWMMVAGQVLASLVYLRKRFRSIIWLRLVLSFYLTISLEKMILYTTSIHRDYPDIFPVISEAFSNSLLNWFICLSFFLFVAVFAYALKKRKISMFNR